MGNDNRQINSFAAMTAPVVLELLVADVISTIVNFILNHYSADAVAVVGSLSQVTGVVANLYAIISVGGSILLGLMIGAGRKEQAGQVIHTMLRYNIYLALILTALSLALTDPLLTAMHLEPRLYPMGRTYLRITLGLSLGSCLLVTYVAICRELGNMKIVLAANSTVYLVTLVLSVIAWKGVPAEKKSLWMFTLPGIIGQFCGVGILASYVHRMQREVQSVRTAGRESRQLLRRILQVGIPGGLEGLMGTFVSAVIASLIGILGTRALLTRAYVGLFTPYLALYTTAANTAVFVMAGRQYGAGDRGQMRLSVKKGTTYSIMVVIVLGAVLYAASGFILRQFFTQDPQLIASVRSLLLWQIAMDIFRAYAACTISALKAITDTRYPLKLMLIGGALSIVLGYVLGIVFHLGLYGFWFGFCADLLFRGIFAMRRWKKMSARAGA